MYKRFSKVGVKVGNRESHDARVDLQKIVSTQFPEFYSKCPSFVVNLLLKVFERILKIQKINDFLLHHRDVRGIAFINKVFEYLDFTYSTSYRYEQKIPTEGRLICVANHPLGALDAMAIIKAISKVRNDVKIVANEILCQINNLSDFLLPYDLVNKRMQKSNLVRILSAIENHEVVIFFPSAEVSRLRWLGIKDSIWQNGAFYFARKYHCPILPIHVQGRNSLLFYTVSILNKSLAMLLLPRELFRQRSKSITLTIGDPIPAKAFCTDFVNPKIVAQLLRMHVYHIDKNGRSKSKKDFTHVNLSS